MLAFFRTSLFVLCLRLVKMHSIPCTRPPRLLLSLRRHSLLQPARLALDVAEARRPGPPVELAQRLAGLVPLALVNLGGGELQQTGWLQRTELRHPLPVMHRVGPAILLLADLRQQGMALRLIRLHFDDRRVCSLRLRRLSRGSVTLGKLLVELEIAPRELRCRE